MEPVGTVFQSARLARKATIRTTNSVKLRYSRHSLIGPFLISRVLVLECSILTATTPGGSWKRASLLPRPFLRGLRLDGVDVQRLDVAKQVLPHRMEAEAPVDHLVGRLGLGPAFDGAPVDLHHRPASVRALR